MSLPEQQTLIDSHCHLDDERFDGQRDEVIERAVQAGVDTFIVPATTASRWPKLARLAQNHDSVHAAYGLHPWFMPEHTRAHLQQLDHWLDQYPAVAVGECGLDFYRGRNDEEQQLDCFRAQLEIAKNHGLPVIIHARQSLDDVLRELRRQPRLQGEVHSFSGSLQQAQQLVDLGFRLGIAATISFERARRLRDVVRRIDVQGLLLESDAPDQPGAAHRGENNEPAFIIEHLQVMAQLREMDSGTLAQQLNNNCRELFGI